MFESDIAEGNGLFQTDQGMSTVFLIEDAIDFFIENDEPGGDFESDACGFPHHQVGFLDEEVEGSGMFGVIAS